MLAVRLAILAAVAALGSARDTAPFDGRNFRGRIAWSCDGNYNDEDDWAASPMALAIFAAAGVKRRLVHFDYNNILSHTNPIWEREHEIGIRGAIERFGYDARLFHDCRKSLEPAVDSLARAINASSSSDPLYLILAGPVEVPLLAIGKSRLERRRFVYCISHSAWNEGFARNFTFAHNKRAVIEAGVRWVQLRDQNAGLATGPFGRPHTEQEWAPWFWMRDSPVATVKFLWERMRATRRADCSDAGMAYFLVSGDEKADIGKLRALLEQGRCPPIVRARSRVRLEAENFACLERFELENTDRNASHRLNVRMAARALRGHISTRFDEPYTARRARYEVAVRYAGGENCRYVLAINGVLRGAWAGAPGDGWRLHTLRQVALATGDEVSISVGCQQSSSPRLDYLELGLQP